MMDKKTGTRIMSEEPLARFIFYRNRLRQDWTVKPDGFIPYPYPNLSVTRHLQLTEIELWNIGRNVARQSGKTLYARADIRASDCERQRLLVTAAPVIENSNHANISGWPREKPAQKVLAQELAAAAGRAREAPPDLG